MKDSESFYCPLAHLETVNPVLSVEVVASHTYFELLALQILIWFLLSLAMIPLHDHFELILPQLKIENGNFKSESNFNFHLHQPGFAFASLSVD